MPKIRFLPISLSLSSRRAVELYPRLTKLLSSSSVFLITISLVRLVFVTAAQAFAGGSPGSPLMAVAA